MVTTAGHRHVGTTVVAKHINIFLQGRPRLNLGLYADGESTRYDYYPIHSTRSQEIATPGAPFSL